jgi:ribosome-binding protein aMBF1 (putative translation factor)
MTAHTIEIAGKRLVILEEADFLRLRSARTRANPQARGRETLPPLPPRNKSGRRPAAAYILASIARDVVRDRKAAGLTQQQLADRAGIRQETLSRIESGKHIPTAKTLQKIEAALGNLR